MTDTAKAKRPLPVSGWIVLAISALYTGLGLMAYLNPAASAAYLGLPGAAAGDTAFIEIYGARNMGLAAICIGLTIMGARRALALTVSIIAVLPLLDILVLWPRLGANAVVIRQFIILAVLAGLSAALWRDARRKD